MHGGIVGWCRRNLSQLAILRCRKSLQQKKKGSQRYGCISNFQILRQQMRDGHGNGDGRGSVVGNICSLFSKQTIRKRAVSQPRNSGGWENQPAMAHGSATSQHQRLWCVEPLPPLPRLLPLPPTWSAAPTAGALSYAGPQRASPSLLSTVPNAASHPSKVFVSH